MSGRVGLGGVVRRQVSRRELNGAASPAARIPQQAPRLPAPPSVARPARRPLPGPGLDCAPSQTHHLGLPQAVVVVLCPVRLGHVGGGPVVAVQDVGLAARAQHELERRLREGGSRWAWGLSLRSETEHRALSNMSLQSSEQTKPELIRRSMLSSTLLATNGPAALLHTPWPHPTPRYSLGRRSQSADRRSSPGTQRRQTCRCAAR